jgi:hypothetical protein
MNNPSRIDRPVCNFITEATEKLKKDVPEDELWEKFKAHNQFAFDDFLLSEALRLLY